MGVKKANEIFGYSIFVVGALKLLLIVLVLAQLTTNLNSIFNGGDLDSTDYTTFSRIVGFAQIIVSFGSIIMIIVNLKRKSGVLQGYFWCLGAILIEFLSFSAIAIYIAFAECGMYMKAGSQIIKENSDYDKSNRTSKKTIKNTEWFYAEPNEQKEKNERMKFEKQKRMAKLEKEIDEWKQLLDSGEIDEETYNQETNRLIEKEKRRSERKKKS